MDREPFHPCAVGQGRVYLAGAIEFAPDGGSGWRREIGKFLQEELGLQPFDPCTNELEVLTEEERLNFRRWKSEAPQLFLPVIRRIIDHDLRQLREHTEFVVCRYDEHCQRGAGTAGELTVAHLHNIPVYVVTEIPLADLSSWLIGCASRVFPTFDGLRAHLREKYLQT